MACIYRNRGSGHSREAHGYRDSSNAADGPTMRKQPRPTQARNSGRAKYSLVVQRQRRWNGGGCPLLGPRLSGKGTRPSYQIFFRERHFTGVRMLGLYLFFSCCQSGNPNLRSRHQYSCDYLATYITPRPLLVRTDEPRPSKYVHIAQRRN